MSRRRFSIYDPTASNHLGSPFLFWHFSSWGVSSLRRQSFDFLFMIQVGLAQPVSFLLSHRTWLSSTSTSSESLLPFSSWKYFHRKFGVSLFQIRQDRWVGGFPGIQSFSLFSSAPRKSTKNSFFFGPKIVFASQILETSETLSNFSCKTLQCTVMSVTIAKEEKKREAM